MSFPARPQAYNVDRVSDGRFRARLWACGKDRVSKSSYSATVKECKSELRAGLQACDGGRVSEPGCIIRLLMKLEN